MTTWKEPGMEVEMETEYETEVEIETLRDSDCINDSSGEEITSKPPSKNFRKKFTKAQVRHLLANLKVVHHQFDSLVTYLP